MKKNLKKVFAAGLAATMVMGTASVAMAATTGTAGDISKDVNAVTFTKTYTLTGNTAEGIYPAEDLAFDITADTNNPTTESISIGTGDIHKVDDDVDTITITLPTYTKVGKYFYTVKEATTDTANKVNATQGVGYYNDEFTVEVLAYWDANRDNILTDCTVKNSSGKITGITNTYDLGGLTVTKEVSGNLANKNQEFDITVTFTTETGKYVQSDIRYDADSNSQFESTIEAGWTGEKTVNLQIKHNETVEFVDIPAGVTYSVAENIKHEATDSNASNPETGYTITYDANKEGTIVKDSVAATTVTNTKGSEIDTGISLDNMPYLMMLAMTVLGAFGFVSKKRKEEEMF